MSSNLPDKINNNGKTSIGDAKKIFNTRNQVFRSITECRITRQNPCAVVILIDQSGSMGRTYIDSKNENKIISEEVSQAVNKFFEFLIFKATKGNEIREYYTFLVIGYGNEEKEDYASIAWEGTLKSKEWITVKELSENIQEKKKKTEMKVPHYGGEPIEITTTEKIWIKAKHHGKNTPMISALKLCQQKIEEFIEKRSDNYPPIVFNITDGLPTDLNELNELIEICNQIKDIETSFGKTILFNCLLSHLSEKRTLMPTIEDIEKLNANKYHETLFEASSILPDFILKEAYIMLKEEKFNQNIPIKALTLNIKPSELLPIFKIGTNTNL
jgi:uncharacterized protein YegL